MAPMACRSRDCRPNSSSCSPAMRSACAGGRITRPGHRGSCFALAWGSDLHGPDGLPLARLPREFVELLSRHEERLRRRADYRAGPPWQLFRTGLGFAAHRVIWPDIGRRLAAAVPTAELVPL